MNDFAGAHDFAEETNDPLIWSILGRAQLKAHLTSDAVLSMTRAKDIGSYKEVIESYQNHSMCTIDWYACILNLRLIYCM